jgi:hypothetical protein
VGFVGVLFVCRGCMGCFCGLFVGCCFGMFVLGSCGCS